MQLAQVQENGQFPGVSKKVNIKDHSRTSHISLKQKH